MRPPSVPAAGFAADTDPRITEWLFQWLPTVGGVPVLATHDDRCTGLRRLVSWYERVITVQGCTDLPPPGGLDALADELTAATSAEAFARLARARWAVRVCEELVQCRQITEQGGEWSLRTAIVHLELVHGYASRQLEGVAS